MKGLRKQIRPIALKTGLLLGWMIFCTVQVLFNYEIASGAAYHNILSFQEEGNAQQGFHTVKDNHPQKGTKKGIRLNKRFFPESTPTIECIVVLAPQQHYIIQHDSAACCTIIPSPLFLMQELRGPPVVA